MSWARGVDLMDVPGVFGMDVDDGSSREISMVVGRTLGVVRLM